MSGLGPADFRRRFLRGDYLVGTFVKTPSPHCVEILGAAGFDFLVIDEEHAPFDRATIDLMLLAARAVGINVLVRTADASPSRLLSVLDAGSAGVIVPHVDSPEAARRLVAACRYSGSRGYSNSPRAGEYGKRAMWDHVDDSDARTTIIAMIEDMQAVSHIEDILAVEGLDGVFVGRADLAVSINDRTDGAGLVRKAALRVLNAARIADRPVCLFVSEAAEATEWHAQGATTFIVSTDQGHLRMGAAMALRDMAKLRTEEP
jgi:2-keto-3-deoxy-L-rhamnonate aldolase RhmA